MCAIMVNLVASIKTQTTHETLQHADTHNTPTLTVIVELPQIISIPLLCALAAALRYVASLNDIWRQHGIAGHSFLFRGRLTQNISLILRLSRAKLGWLCVFPPPPTGPKVCQPRLLLRQTANAATHKFRPVCPMQVVVRARSHAKQ